MESFLPSILCGRVSVGITGADQYTECHHSVSYALATGRRREVKASISDPILGGDSDNGLCADAGQGIPLRGASPVFPHMFRLAESYA